MEISVTIESIKPITLDQLSREKTYVVFNSTSFYIHSGDDLKCLTNQDDINMTTSQLFDNIGPAGSHYVAECESMDAALDYFNSGHWRSYSE
jgi:hypothetical protein